MAKKYCLFSTIEKKYQKISYQVFSLDAFHWSINDLSCQTTVQIYLLCIFGDNFNKSNCIKSQRVQKKTHNLIRQKKKKIMPGHFAKPASLERRGEKKKKPL